MAKKAMTSGSDPACPHCKGQRRHSKNARKSCKSSGSRGATNNKKS